MTTTYFIQRDSDKKFLDDIDYDIPSNPKFSWVDEPVHLNSPGVSEIFWMPGYLLNMPGIGAISMSEAEKLVGLLPAEETYYILPYELVEKEY